MISSARTANFDTHSYLKIKEEVIFFKVKGHISRHISKDYYLNIIFILCKYHTGCITKLSPACKSYKKYQTMSTFYH